MTSIPRPPSPFSLSRTCPHSLPLLPLLPLFPSLSPSTSPSSPSSPHPPLLSRSPNIPSLHLSPPFLFLIPSRPLPSLPSPLYPSLTHINSPPAPFPPPSIRPLVSPLLSPLLLPLQIPSFPPPSPDFLPLYCVQALINPPENVRFAGDFMSSGLLTRVKLGPGRSFGAPSRLPRPVIGPLRLQGPQSADRYTDGVIRTSTRGRLSVVKTNERIFMYLAKRRTRKKYRD